MPGLLRKEKKSHKEVKFSFQEPASVMGNTATTAACCPLPPWHSLTSLSGRGPHTPWVVSEEALGGWGR